MLGAFAALVGGLRLSSKGGLTAIASACCGLRDLALAATPTDLRWNTCTHHLPGLELPNARSLVPAHEIEDGAPCAAVVPAES
jgi:hypothetical protein